MGGKGGKWFDARYEVKVQGVGSNLWNVKIQPRTTTSTETAPLARPARDAKGRFVRTQDPAIYNRKSQYPSGYRAGVKNKVLDDNTITKGKHAGKVLTVDGDKVSRNDPRLTIEHNKPVVEHWNEQGYNSGRAARNDFYNDTNNMSLRLRSANSSDGAKMMHDGIRYRQDVGLNYD